MYRLKKWTFCGKKDTTDSPVANKAEVSVQTAFTHREIVHPKYWIEYADDDKAQVVALGIHLPGCSMDRISIGVWNSKRLIVRGFSEFRLYELQFELPPGAGPVCESWFAAKEVLTCRYRAPLPVCIVCKGSIFSNHFIEIRDSLVSIPVVAEGSSVDLLKPQFWITYDGKQAALLEVHLEGCRSATQINLSVDNYEVRIEAYLNTRQAFKLKLRLNSSAKPGWETHFDEQLEMFTCSIPLLGHFECRKRTSVQHIKPRGPLNEESSEVDFEAISVLDFDQLETLPTDTIMTVD